MLHLQHSLFPVQWPLSQILVGFLSPGWYNTVYSLSWIYDPRNVGMSEMFSKFLLRSQTILKQTWLGERGKEIVWAFIFQKSPPSPPTFSLMEQKIQNFVPLAKFQKFQTALIMHFSSPLSMWGSQTKKREKEIVSARESVWSKRVRERNSRSVWMYIRQGERRCRHACNHANTGKLKKRIMQWGDTNLKWLSLFPDWLPGWCLRHRL